MCVLRSFIPGQQKKTARPRMFRHFVPSRELHSLATLVRLSLVDLPSANSMKCCSPPASLISINLEEFMIKRMMMALCIFVCTFTLVACSGQQTNEPLTLGVNAIKTEIDKENKIITTKDSEEKGVLGNDCLIDCSKIPMIYSKYEVMKRCISGMNFPDYRYEQLIKMIFAQHIPDFHSMYMLPERLRSNLAETFGTSVCGLVPVTHRASGQADKVLFQLKDGNCVETVNLHYKKGWESFCVSSQCGCGFGCKFCATGAIGHKRNMTADEITDQILYFYLAGHQINSVSFMGMGEPFANPNLFDALKILTNPSLFGLSQRRITISTIGMIPGIKRLTRDFPQVNLAFSLHSPFEKQRSELMPINQTYPLHKVMDALDAHVANTKRRLFLAYIMLGGINDSAEHAKALAHLILSRGALSYLYHVDLIPYNATDKTARKFTASNHEAIKNFSDILHSNRISVAIRMQFGSDIGAGCGQLYADERD